MDDRPIRGIFPALVTTYDKSGGIDTALQRELISRLIAQGAHGFFICGTTAEFPVLALEEREKLTELVASEVTGQVPITVHVASPQVGDAVRLAQHAARAGAQAISSIPPYYYPTRRSSALDYLREIATSTELPFYYYHIPGCTGFPIDVAFAEQLVKLPNFAGMKWSDPNFALFQQVQSAIGNAYQFVCGVDCMFLSSLLLGGQGAVGSNYNYLLPVFRRMWAEYESGDLVKARELQLLANRFINVIDRYPNIAAVKGTLSVLDFDVGGPRAPISDLDAKEKTELKAALEAAGLWEIEGISPSYQRRS